MTQTTGFRTLAVLFGLLLVSIAIDLVDDGITNVGGRFAVGAITGVFVFAFLWYTNRNRPIEVRPLSPGAITFTLAVAVGAPLLSDGSSILLVCVWGTVALGSALLGRG